MSDTALKSTIFKEDLALAGGGTGAVETGTRRTSTGGTITLTKIDASIFNSPNGIAVTNFGELVLATNSIASTGGFIHIMGDIDIDDDYAISVALIVDNGANFNIATGKTLTINGYLAAGPYKIFNYTGTGKVVFGATSPTSDMYPEWWGAVGDAVVTTAGTAVLSSGTDDYVAFDQAIECIWYSGKGNLILSRLYWLSKTLSIYNHHNSNLKNIHITGRGQDRTGIFSTAYGYAAMEVLGCAMCKFTDFSIYGSGVDNKTPTVAILTGRTVNASYAGLRTNGSSANSENIFEKIAIRGHYQWGQIYDTNGSSNRYDHVYSYAGPLAAAHADNHWRFGIAICGGTLLTGDPFSLPRRYNTDTGSNVGQASDNVTVVDTSFTGIAGATANIPADAAAIYVYKSTWVNFKNVYTGSLTNSTADIIQLVDGGHGNFLSCPSESLCRYVVSITAPAGAITSGRIMISGLHGSAVNTLALYTDSNAGLKDCLFDLSSIAGATGGVYIGTNSYGCTYKLAQTATSFTVASGNFYGNTVSFGASMVNYNVSGATMRNNIINDQRSFAGGLVEGYQTILSGDVLIGKPDYTTSHVLTIDEFKIAFRSAAPTTGSWARGSVIFNTAATTSDPAGWSCILDNTFGTLNSGNTKGTVDNNSSSLNVNSISGLTIGNWLDITGGATNPFRVTNIVTTTKAIEALTRAAACVVTVTGHGLLDNSYVVISGLSAVTSPGWEVLNATHKITRINADSFSVAVNTSGLAADYNATDDPSIITIYTVSLYANNTGGLLEDVAVAFHNETTGDAFKAWADLV